MKKLQEILCYSPTYPLQLLIRFGVCLLKRKNKLHLFIYILFKSGIEVEYYAQKLNL
jgi:hypothetical protein